MALADLPRDEKGVVMGAADGLAVDAAGRLYAATGVGVQVFSPQGQHLGTDSDSDAAAVNRLRRTGSRRHSTWLAAARSGRST